MSLYQQKQIRNLKHPKEILENMPTFGVSTRSAESLVGARASPWLNTLRLRQNGWQFADDIFKCIFLNENLWISFKISLRFVPKGPICNIPALVQIMAWHRPVDKTLSEPMVVRLLMLEHWSYVSFALSHWVVEEHWLHSWVRHR